MTPYVSPQRTYTVVVIETVRTEVILRALSKQAAREQVLSSRIPAGVVKRSVQSITERGAA